MKATTARSTRAGKPASLKKGNKNTELMSPVLNAGFPQALGIRVVSLDKKKVVGEMEIKPMHMNRSGRVAGGAIMALADVLGAVGSVLVRLPGHRGGTIESKTNFFAPGRGPKLTAVSIPLHVGRTTSVWQTSVKNTDGRLVAIVTQTQIALPIQQKAAEDEGT